MNPDYLSVIKIMVSNIRFLQNKYGKNTLLPNDEIESLLDYIENLNCHKSVKESENNE